MRGGGDGEPSPDCDIVVAGRDVGSTLLYATTVDLGCGVDPGPCNACRKESF